MKSESVGKRWELTHIAGRTLMIPTGTGTIPLTCDHHTETPRIRIASLAACFEMVSGFTDTSENGG